MRQIIVRGLWLFALVALLPAELSAQLAEGGVARNASGGAPYECLHVALLDSAGKFVENTVTDSAGRFLLEAPRPGVYRVQFLIYGAEPLTGPLDTLKEGDFKQRAYPLGFKSLALPISSDTGPETKEFWRQRNLLYGNLREQERESGWKSRETIPGAYGPHYPSNLRSAGTRGTVTSQFIVDSTGRARSDSWHAIDATHVDFAKAVARSVPEWRYKPAQNHGQPVCELSFSFIEFYMDGIARIAISD